MTEFVKVAKVNDIPAGRAKAIEVNGRRIAIFNVEGTFHALDDNCNHKGGPLSQGAIEANAVTCPWHGAVFEISSGNPLKAPAKMPMQTYKTRVKDGEIEVEIL